jgi:hypothetical protein
MLIQNLLFRIGPPASSALILLNHETDYSALPSTPDPLG